MNRKQLLQRLRLEPVTAAELAEAFKDADAVVRYLKCITSGAPTDEIDKAKGKLYLSDWELCTILFELVKDHKLVF